jgi:hypothetical protein
VSDDSSIDSIFGDILLSSGLERMETPTIYRGTIDSPLDPSRRQNVFVSLADDDFSVMAPIGEAANLNQGDVDAARDPDDGCTVIVVGSYGALQRPVDINEIIQIVDDEPKVTLVSFAIEHGEYADRVIQRIADNRENRRTLVNTIQRWMDDDDVTAGRVSPDQFVDTFTRALDLVRDPEFLASVSDYAVRASIADWAASGDPSLGIDDMAWSKVHEALDAMWGARGWTKIHSDGTPAS